MSTPARRSPPPAALHRSGAVARMLRMPVATLRVWERRYALTNSTMTPGGQRLYSADDVHRLAMLKQLSERGHAIGSLASLDLEQLKHVASTHAQALAVTQMQPRVQHEPAPRAWRLVVVGQELGARLHRPALLRQLGRPLELLGPFDDVPQAVAALSARTDARTADAWLLHQPQLHEGWLAAFEAAALKPKRARQPKPAAVPVAVLFGYAADAVCEALAAGGVTLLREPQPDAALAQWLRQWAHTPAVPASGRPRTGASASEGAAVAGRRWADAALTDFASRSTTVACECPRQVAELLMQLSHFEDYSLQCEQRSPADADLHAFLGRVAADARAGFEMALEQVALREGLLLPPSSR